MEGERAEEVPAAEVDVTSILRLGWDALSPQVRGRLLAVVADVLPTVPGVGPALRKVAGFTPARRARTGAAALTEALGDPEFVGKVATQVTARHPERVADLALGPAADGGPDEAPVGTGRRWLTDHPADAAALAWLTAPDAFEVWNTAAHEGVQGQDSAAQQQERVDELSRQLRDVAKDHRAELRARDDEHKALNADLRRKLGETRSALRAARDAHEGELQAAQQARAEAERARDLADSEVRRLKGRLEELERRGAESRSDERATREEESTRARLLLDTLMDAASGLRRELALPPLSQRPADRIAAAIDEATAPTLTSGPLITTSGRLEQHLAAPQVHLVLDGYNVTRSVWENTSLETQRTRLLSLLPPLAARTRAEVTVVFDAASVTARPTVAVPRGVRVLFSPPDVIADDVIRDLVAAEPTGRPVLVVTADAAVLRDVRADGALTVSPQALLHLLARDLRS